jgi:hypothetical protein
MGAGKILSIRAALLVAFISLAGASRCCAQAILPSQAESALGINSDNSSDGLPTDSNQITGTSPAASSPPQSGSDATDAGWHIATSAYLWFPGIHGTIGALGRDTGVSSSPVDLLAKFRFGFMGAVEGRYKRVVLPLDMFWVRIGDDKALPFPNLMATTAKVKGSEFILTPKIGYRLIDQEKFKIDALAGIRYWHFGENLQFTPSNLNLNFSSSQNWVDPVVGGRIQVALSPKIKATVLGDVGGWGAGSQLDYQVAGFLGYRIKPTWTLIAGYRYLFVDYRSPTTTINLVTSGILFGITMNLK